MRSLNRILQLALWPLLSACATPVTGPLEVSAWGGEGVSLTVTAAGAQLEFDCATGAVPNRILLDSGDFSLVGTVTLEHGGPVREGEPPDVHPASFDGSVAGNRMKLTVAIHDPLIDYEPTQYELFKGAPPMLRKCL